MHFPEPQKKGAFCCLGFSPPYRYLSVHFRYAPNTKNDRRPPALDHAGQYLRSQCTAIYPQGTFTAFAKSLDRLKAMGVQTLWFMPINPISKIDRKGSLGSYYAVSNYTAINPEYGNFKDFKRSRQNHTC